MQELPESINVARQLDRAIKGKMIRKVVAGASPHRFAFYFGDPGDYQTLLSGRKINRVSPVAGFVEIEAENARILFSDGSNIRFYKVGEPVPARHQLYIEFEDSSSIVCTVQMYGGLWAYRAGENDNPYYLAAKDKPSPLSDGFDQTYFNRLFGEARQTLSVKALLATEQRIPGLGNGVLQDILFNAGVNPASIIGKLDNDEKESLFKSIKNTLAQMAAEGGRDTEKDIFGQEGRYRTIMSAKTVQQPCPKCGSAIDKKAYMGGSVYYCPVCQPIKK